MSEFTPEGIALTYAFEELARLRSLLKFHGPEEKPKQRERIIAAMVKWDTGRIELLLNGVFRNDNHDKSERIIFSESVDCFFDQVLYYMTKSDFLALFTEYEKDKQDAIANHS